MKKLLFGLALVAMAGFAVGCSDKSTPASTTTPAGAPTKGGVPAPPPIPPPPTNPPPPG